MFLQEAHVVGVGGDSERGGKKKAKIKRIKGKEKKQLGVVFHKTD